MRFFGRGKVGVGFARGVNGCIVTRVIVTRVIVTRVIAAVIIRPKVDIGINNILAFIEVVRNVKANVTIYVAIYGVAVIVNIGLVKGVAGERIAVGIKLRLRVTVGVEVNVAAVFVIQQLDIILVIGNEGDNRAEKRIQEILFICGEVGIELTGRVGVIIAALVPNVDKYISDVAVIGRTVGNVETYATLFVGVDGSTAFTGMGVGESVAGEGCTVCLKLCLGVAVGVEVYIGSRLIRISLNIILVICKEGDSLTDNLGKQRLFCRGKGSIRILRCVRGYIRVCAVITAVIGRGTGDREGQGQQKNNE